MPVIAETFKGSRQEVSANLGDGLVFTASGGSTTTVTTTDSFIASQPNDEFNGAEISAISGTGSPVTRTVSDFAVSAGTATFTVGPAITTPDTTTVCELHNLKGRGWLKAQYDNAINAAIRAASEAQFTDTDALPWASQRNEGSARQEAPRREYPMPSGFLYLWGVQALSRPPITRWPSGNTRTQRSLGDATARTRLGQGFKTGQDTTLQYVAVFMAKVGSPTDNLSIVFQGDSSGLPDGSALTNGTSANVVGSTLDTRLRWVVFKLAAPVYCLGTTQYHFDIRRSGAVDPSNYYVVGEDTQGTYQDGSLEVYGGVSWTAVAASDMIFALSQPAPWVSLSRANWEQGNTEVRIAKLPTDGTPFRLLGGAALSEVSSETDAIPLNPAWVVQYATQHLLRQQVGTMSPDNTGSRAASAAQGLGLVPPVYRPLPPDSIRVT